MDLGTFQIRNEVIGTIASLAAAEVPGVVGISKGFFSWLGWPQGRGVWMEVREQDLRLRVSLIVEYGVSLPTVAVQVQERVREMIERMTHLSVSEVQVRVHHIQPKRGGSVR